MVGIRAKTQCLRFFKTLAKPNALAVVIPVAIAHYVAMVYCFFLGSEGGNKIAYYFGLLLGAPLVTLSLVFEWVLPPFDTPITLAVINSLIWGVTAYGALRVAFPVGSRR